MPQTYILRIFKSWKGRNSKNSWVNTYAYVSDVPLDDSKWIALVNSVCAGEQQFHLSDVNYLHAVVSTYNQEAKYAYENLRTFTLDGTGARNALTLAGGTWPEGASPAADLNYALQMNKIATLGRTGKLFYRGCLVWPNIVIDGNGKPSLSPTGLARFGAGDMLNTNQLFLQQSEDFTWVIMPDPKNAIQGAPTGTTPDGGTTDVIDVRNVMGLGLGGVVLLKRDHRYYDRQTPREKQAEALLKAKEAEEAAAAPLGGTV